MIQDNRESMNDVLRWALDATHDPATASADWLASDIDPARPSAVELLSSPDITLAQLRKAKDVYKTLRIVGETPADRRLGARLYLAAIAAALVLYGKHISRQSDPAMTRALKSLLDDRQMPQPLRDLAGKALCVLKNERRVDG